MVRFQEELVDRYVALYCDTLRPYTSLSECELRLRCAGIIGAADAIGREVVRKRFDREEATASERSVDPFAGRVAGGLAARAGHDGLHE